MNARSTDDPPFDRRTEARKVLMSMAGLEFDSHNAHFVYVLWWTNPDGSLQPIVWPMRLEREEPIQ